MIFWIRPLHDNPTSAFNRNYYHLSTLSVAIGSLGCRRNSSGGSMLIRQLTELQLLTCSRTEGSADIPVHSAGYHHCLSVADSGNTLLSGRKISWVICIRTPVSSLHLISPLKDGSWNPRVFAHLSGQILADIQTCPYCFVCEEPMQG